MILTKPKSISAGPSDGTGEGVAHSKRWYVALVRMHHEKKVAERLDKIGIENFVPVQQEIHQWSDRRKKVQKVIIPMCIFVRVTYPERLDVLHLPSVNRFMVLRGESTPATIPESQMERFKFMLDYSEQTVEMCYEHLQPGERVRVIKGSLTGLEGELITIGDKSKVAVRIDILGVALVEMPIGFVEKLA